jgi:hypothetical protein
MTSFLNRIGFTKKSAKHESGKRREGQDESPVLPQIRTLGTVRSHSRNRTFTVWNEVRPLRSDEERYVYVTVAPAECPILPTPGFLNATVMGTELMPLCIGPETGRTMQKSGDGLVRESSSTTPNAVVQPSQAPWVPKQTQSLLPPVTVRQSTENDMGPSMQEEDILPPSAMHAVGQPGFWETAIGKLCSLSVEVRAFFENDAQSNHDTSLRHVHDEHCFDRIIQEVLRIIQLIRDKHRAKKLKESSEKGLLAKLTRMLEKISKGSIPAFKNILKVGVTGSAVCSLTCSSLCLFNKR